MLFKKTIKGQKIINDQKLFFNLDAKKMRPKIMPNKLFFDYVNKEQVESFRWLKNSRYILDYGCGTGTSIRLFLRDKNPINYVIQGVDIAENAIKIAQKRYPQFKFYKITNNKMPRIKNNSLDAVIMSNILHHTCNHLDIFKEIHLKLKKGGKFLINDLSSNNIINKLGRLIFIYLPPFIKNKFKNDLVIDGRIPEKYKVDIKLIVSQLKKTGFLIKEVGYGHLFFFLFIWVDNFIPLSKSKIINYLYKKLINFERFLLQYNFFKKHAEVFYIKCFKK